MRIDADGRVFIAFEAIRPDHSKYCRIMQQMSDNTLIDVLSIHDLWDTPQWVEHPDGTVIVQGLNHAKDEIIKADVPQFKSKKT